MAYTLEVTLKNVHDFGRQPQDDAFCIIYASQYLQGHISHSVPQKCPKSKHHECKCCCFQQHKNITLVMHMGVGVKMPLNTAQSPPLPPTELCAAALEAGCP